MNPWFVVGGLLVSYMLALILALLFSDDDDDYE